jgi:3-methyladenine DNA glycosylase AlkD
MKVEEIIKKLKTFKDPWAVKGMSRYGINPKNNLGISVTRLRKMAKEIETGMEDNDKHELAANLWDSGLRDARMLACLIDDPKQVTVEQMERWVNEFNSWDVCDLVCGHLFDKTEVAYDKAEEWTKSDKVYVKRAGFSMMAWLAVHDKDSDDEPFLKFLKIIEDSALDERKYVKKAVNWALRQIGKRNIPLNIKAMSTAVRIHELESKTAQWIANDAMRELSSDAVQGRLESRRSRDE